MNPDSVRWPYVTTYGNTRYYRSACSGASALPEADRVYSKFESPLAMRGLKIAPDVTQRCSEAQLGEHLARVMATQKR
jgi:hypothetical protein